MTSVTTSSTDGVIDAAVRQQIIESLRGRFAGERPPSRTSPGLRASQDGVWNAMVDKRPGADLDLHIHGRRGKRP